MPERLGGLRSASQPVRGRKIPYGNRNTYGKIAPVPSPWINSSLFLLGFVLHSLIHSPPPLLRLLPLLLRLYLDLTFSSSSLLLRLPLSLNGNKPSAQCALVLLPRSWSVG